MGKHTARPATLVAEYRAAGIDPALIAIIDDAAAELSRREVKATELIVALKYRRRFGVRRLPVNRVRIGERVVKLEQRTPWVIRDDSRPYWLGYAPTHEAAMLAIDNMLAEVSA